MIELDFPLAGTNALIRINTQEDFIRFEVEGYTPGYEGHNEDPGQGQSYETVKAFLVVGGKFEIELTDVQAELAFKVYEQEFFREMEKQNKRDKEAHERDKAIEDEYYKNVARFWE